MGEAKTGCSLGKFDKNRLGELIIIYLSPKNNFEIKDDGSVVIGKNGPVADWFFRENKQQDFLSTCHALVTEISGKKANNELAKFLCLNALGALMMTGDREKVIKLLYQAHLSEA